MSYFLGTLLRYFLNDFEMLLVDTVITGITFVFCISHALYFYCKVIIIIIIGTQTIDGLCKVFGKLYRNLGGSSPLCALTSILISGYVRQTQQYEGWNFNNGNYLFTTDTK